MFRTSQIALPRPVLRIFSLGLLTLTLGVSVFAGPQEVPAATFRTVQEIQDWGAATTKVILNLGVPVTKGAVTKNSFLVHVTRSDARLEKPFLEEGDRKVLGAYVSTQDGNPTYRSTYVTLDLEYGPMVSLSSPLNYNKVNGWIKCDYVITQQGEIAAESGKITGLAITKSTGEIRKLVDDFAFSKGTYDSVTLNMASFAPKKDGRKHPLIVWLHGGGEGGLDASIPLSANKAVNFITPEIQAYFDGAFVLVPQSPTMWYEGFKALGDGTSKHEKAVMELIKDFVGKNPDVDATRIYLGGCSSGGYGTMLLIRDYPGYFAAAFPVCEALADNLVSDADVKKMAATPTWFTIAKNDPAVKSRATVLPTYSRMINAGATDVHLFLPDEVLDTSGKYMAPDGSPLAYFGHFSWIYAFNNTSVESINGKTVSLMEWLASHSLAK